MKNSTQSNPLFGLFELFDLIKINLKIFVIFFIATFVLLLSLILYDTGKFSDRTSVSEGNIWLTAVIPKKASIEIYPLYKLTEDLSKVLSHTEHRFGGTTYKAPNIFDPIYLYKSYFEILDSFETINKVLRDNEIISDEMDIAESDNIIYGYQKRIIKDMYQAEVGDVYNIKIEFETKTGQNKELQKKILIDIIFTSQEIVREVFIENMNKLIKRFDSTNQFVIKENLKKFELLKLHYDTALKLNIKSPQYVSEGSSAFSSIESPLFFQLGTDYIEAIIDSLSDSISDSDYTTAQMLSDNLETVIVSSNIYESNTPFLFDFNTKSIVEILITGERTRNLSDNPIDKSERKRAYIINFSGFYLFKYVSVALFGFILFVFYILIIKNYKIYKTEK